MAALMSFLICVFHAALFFVPAIVVFFPTLHGDNERKDMLIAKLVT